MHDRPGFAPPATRARDSLAVVLVHYHTPELAAEAVAAVQRDLAASGGGWDVEWILVDNGSDAAGRALLERLPVRLLDPGRNVGYAGGVNLGVAASRAEHIVLMNPDVLVLPGCIAALVECLRRGAAAAGPRFFWDAGRRLALPPGEPRSRRGELAAWLAATRGGSWAAAARRTSRRHCRRHWLAREPLASYALSGSLLAVTRQAWNRIGAFDEGFQLYFEETDWLLRLRRAGLPARFVPAAQAVHLFGRSAAREPRAQQWFEASARRFRRRHYGAWFAAALERLDSLPRDVPAVVVPPLPAAGLDLDAYPRPLWVEVSPLAAGFPAAAELLAPGAAAGPWQLPAEVRLRLDDAVWYVGLSDQHRRDLGRFRIDPVAGAGGD